MAAYVITKASGQQQATKYVLEGVKNYTWTFEAPAGKLVERVTLDLGVAGLDPMLGVEIT